jgi:hypothetical protein
MLNVVVVLVDVVVVVVLLMLLFLFLFSFVLAVCGACLFVRRGETTTVYAEIFVPNVNLWSIPRPYLYTGELSNSS